MLVKVMMYRFLIAKLDMKLLKGNVNNMTVIW